MISVCEDRVAQLKSKVQARKQAPPKPKEEVALSTANVADTKVVKAEESSDEDFDEMIGWRSKAL